MGGDRLTLTLSLFSRVSWSLTQRNLALLLDHRVFHSGPIKPAFGIRSDLLGDLLIQLTYERS